MNVIKLYSIHLFHFWHNRTRLTNTLWSKGTGNKTEVSFCKLDGINRRLLGRENGKGMVAMQKRRWVWCPPLASSRATYIAMGLSSIFFSPFSFRAASSSRIRFVSLDRMVGGDEVEENCVPLLTSHTRTVLSAPPETRTWLSALKSSAYTWSWCPVNVFNRRPEPKSHRLTVESSPTQHNRQRTYPYYRPSPPAYLLKPSGGHSEKSQRFWSRLYAR